MTEAEFVRKTQDTLGVIIKKPPLTDKLLAKPPFRFLHDVMMAVIKTTGFMDGLYSGYELDSQQVNDKEKKIAFLQKAIDLLQLINGEILSVKPSKVVAGQEPDKTNEFLQALAKAITKQPNSKEFVQRVLNGDKGGETNSAGSNKENKKSSSSRSSSKEKPKDDAKEKSTNKEESSSKDKSKTRSSSKESKERDSSSAKTSKRESSADRNSKTKDKDEQRSSSKSRDKKSHDEIDDKKKDKKSDDKKSSEKEKKSDDKKSDKDKKSSKIEESEKKEKSSKKRDDETNEKKPDEKEKKHKSKKKDDSNEETNHLSTTSMNGTEESKVKKEKLKIDLSKKASDDNEEMINGENYNEPPNSPKGLPRGRRGSLSAKDGGSGRTLSAFEGRKESVQLEDDDVLVKPGLVRQTRSARPATASSTTARPGTAAGRPASVKQDPVGLKRKEISFDDQKKLTRSESIVQEQVVGKVITESHKNGVDDDDNFIVDDSGPSAIDALLNDQMDGDGNEEVNERDDHGQLVRKILETKKGLETQLKSDGKPDKTIIVYDAKEREKTKQESQKLQELVQHLTRNSHPLGKIVDFLQEDVDSMLKELQQWRQEYKTNMANVRQELGSSSGQLEPLKTKLNEMGQQINEQIDAITAVRGRMLENEEKIQKMFTSMAKK